MKLYAIKKGRKNNVVVETWAECQDLTKGFPGMEFKSFSDMRDAEEYLKGAKLEQMIFCKAKCEYNVADRCTNHIVSIDEKGHCINY